MVATFKEFKLEDIFEVKTTKQKYNANAVTIYKDSSNPGTHPYVVRTEYNNGIRGYIEGDKEGLNPGNTISFGQDTFVCFYQEQPYFTGDKMKVLSLKKEKMSKASGIFMSAVISKSFAKTTWGQIANINTAIIALPVTIDGSLDTAYMETYIRATQKEVINKLVRWNAISVKTLEEKVS